MLACTTKFPEVITTCRGFDANNEQVAVTGKGRCIVNTMITNGCKGLPILPWLVLSRVGRGKAATM